MKRGNMLRVGVKGYGLTVEGNGKELANGAQGQCWRLKERAAGQML